MPLHFDLSGRNSEDLDKAPKYQNTYRLDSDKPFKIDPIDRIVKSVMTNRLEDLSYDVNECPKLCGQVAAEIRKRILKLEFERYKIVVAVSIIEKASQSMETSMGFLWDVDRDNYSTYTYETQTFFAYCIVIVTFPFNIGGPCSRKSFHVVTKVYSMGEKLNVQLKKRIKDFMDYSSCTKKKK